MSNNKKRHQILRIVHASLKNSGDGVTPVEIKGKMNIDDIRLVSLLKELLDGRYLSGDSKKCHMTHKGVNAYTGKEFLNQMWYRNWSFWFSLTALVVSIFALLYKK